MKILQILPTLNPDAGGVASAVLGLSRGLARLGHEVEIAVLDDPDAAWLAGTDLKIHELGAGRTSYCYAKQLAPWLRQNAGRFDCVIVNGLWQFPGLAVWRHFHRSGIPYVVFPHGMLDHWFKRTYPLKHVKKWFYWPWAEYRILRDARAVIFTSEQERIEAKKSFWLYRAREKISPLGLETPPPVSPAMTEAFLKMFPRLRNQRALLFLGRLHPKKGCDIAIEALATCPAAADLSLIFAGPDQIGWRQELEKLAAKLGVESRVVFTGMLNGEIKQGAFGAAEALLLPSHQENFGMSVVEALATGLPVLISNRVDIWREIEKEGAGCVENDDVSGVRSLMTRWSDMTAAERDAMCLSAQQCFRNRFEISRAAASLSQILAEPMA